MKTVCKKDMCTGCNACVNICPKDAVEVLYGLSDCNAVINEELCINCNMCYNVCQKKHKLYLARPIVWKQGWSRDEIVREQGTSGGLATAILKSFLKTNGFVCSCVFENGEFVFKLTDNDGDIVKFTGSKYVKSNTKDIYVKIKNKLTAGDRVLFIGLPCQVAGLKMYLRNNTYDNLYTIDLICHGTPSQILLKDYLTQNKCNLDECKSISFRDKNKYRLICDGKEASDNKCFDIYLYSFLKCLNFTTNCYSCDFARVERCSDLTLGDSWGSDFNEKEKRKGISLVLCQTKKGLELLNKSSLVLAEVDRENAVFNNKQLQHPSKNKYNTRFFRFLKKTRRYDIALFVCYPIVYIKQMIKNYRLKLYKIVIMLTHNAKLF